MSEPEKPAAPTTDTAELKGSIGKYELVRVLGKGAMGVVYLAHDTVLERDVALKVMVSGIANDPELKMRFEREARAIAKIAHPGIVTVYDLGSHSDGSPFIAMELLRGQDLAHTMRQGPMRLDRAVSIVAQVLAGLNQAHQAGIIHRDVKPANVFLNADGTVKIMDFGVARLTTASMTGTGHIVGTADYMSPEQVKGAKVDGRSDVFSVGSLFYELLTGRKPFHAENLMAIFYRIINEEPDFGLVPEGPAYAPLLPILRKALAKELDQRYKTAFAFMADLRDYLRQYGASASAQQTLEELLEIEPPPTPPPPSTGPGARPRYAVQATQIVADTSELSPAAPVDREPHRTVRRASAPRSGLAAVQASPMPRRKAGRYALVGLAATLLAGGGAYLLLFRPAPQPAPPAAPTPAASQTPLSTPEATAAPVATPPQASPTPAPTIAPTEDRSASAMRAGQAAFARGDYDGAVSEGQKVLAKDAGHAEAKRLVESALNGQRADARYRAAEAALMRGEHAQALAEAEAGRALAPWDARGADLVARARAGGARAQLRLQQQQASLAAQIVTLLDRADEALAAKKYDVAVSLYDEALKLDPQNARAGLGRTGALTLRATAQAAATAEARPEGPATRSFVPGRTVAQSSTQAAGDLPEGFEASTRVTVQRGSQVSQPPGRIIFDVRPDPVRAGESYSVTVSFTNEGGASVPLKEMTVRTTVNGRRAGGLVPLTVSEVAPRQRVVLLSQSDLWKEDTATWSMEVTLRTARGETYRNQVTWR